MIIYLPAPVFLASSEQLDASSEKVGLDGPPLSFRPRATIPEDHSRKIRGYGPAALPLFCLAPHGVFPASRITPRAVSSYLAFSPLPALFSKNRRCLFCDTFRHRNSESFRRCGARVFYAACCRMVFGLSSSKSFDSPAIICHRRLIYHIGRRRKPRITRMKTDYQSFSDFLEYPCHLSNQRFYLFCPFVPHIISLQCARKNFFSLGRASRTPKHISKCSASRIFILDPGS